MSTDKQTIMIEGYETVVRAYDLLRMFARQGRPTSLRQAFTEYGRIDETLRLLSMLDPMDSTYRRSPGKQLSVQESRPRRP
ncbi:Tn3 family transposase [Streptosporangium sp. NPDC004631]